tara:strand:+ start:231 stop:341 length:111 start_codon:yes stop_codon:yes gene_type:complete
MGEGNNTTHKGKQMLILAWIVAIATCIALPVGLLNE